MCVCVCACVRRNIIFPLVFLTDIFDSKGECVELDDRDSGTGDYPLRNRWPNATRYCVWVYSLSMCVLRLRRASYWSSPSMSSTVSLYSPASRTRPTTSCVIVSSVAVSKVGMLIQSFIIREEDDPMTPWFVRSRLSRRIRNRQFIIDDASVHAHGVCMAGFYSLPLKIDNFQKTV